MSNANYLAATAQTVILFLIAIIVLMVHKVQIDKLENIVSQQQVKIENQSLSIIMLESKLAKKNIANDD